MLPRHSRTPWANEMCRHPRLASTRLAQSGGTVSPSNSWLRCRARQDHSSSEWFVHLECLSNISISIYEQKSSWKTVPEALLFIDQSLSYSLPDTPNLCCRPVNERSVLPQERKRPIYHLLYVEHSNMSSRDTTSTRVNQSEFIVL